MCKIEWKLQTLNTFAISFLYIARFWIRTNGIKYWSKVRSMCYWIFSIISIVVQMFSQEKNKWVRSKWQIEFWIYWLLLMLNAHFMLKFRQKCVFNHRISGHNTHLRTPIYIISFNVCICTLYEYVTLYCTISTYPIVYSY